MSTKGGRPCTEKRAKRVFRQVKVARRPVDVGFATTGAERRPGEEPAFLLFPLCFFFSASLFPLFFSISLAPRLRRDAFIFLFAFVFLFIFSFCFFAFLFAFFFLLFSLYFSSDFLFLFFFVISFYFFFFLLFLFSLFFVFLFALLFILLTPISFLIIQPLAGHSFFLPRRQFLPFYPATSGSGKKEKISAKESTVVRWLPGSERAEGGKTEGRNGAPRGMEKMYTTRDGTMGGKK